MSSYFALTSGQVQKAVAAVIKSRPVYAEILSFYTAVFNAQEASKGRIELPPIELAEELLNRVGAEFSVVDISESDALFERYGVTIPVLRRENGRELNWPFDEAGLRAFLSGD